RLMPERLPIPYQTTKPASRVHEFRVHRRVCPGDRVGQGQDPSRRNAWRCRRAGCLLPDARTHLANRAGDRIAGLHLGNRQPVPGTAVAGTTVRLFTAATAGTFTGRTNASCTACAAPLS